MGTWIEISNVITAWRRDTSRSLRGNVDRNIDAAFLVPVHCGRSLRGNVDRNINITTEGFVNDGRSLRGNVDRNGFVVPNKMDIASRSLRGNVDRNPKIPMVSLRAFQSFPTWERG